MIPFLAVGPRVIAVPSGVRKSTLGRSSHPNGELRQQHIQELYKFTSSQLILGRGLFQHLTHVLHLLLVPCKAQVREQDAGQAESRAAVCKCGEGAVGHLLHANNIPAFL